MIALNVNKGILPIPMLFFVVIVSTNQCPKRKKQAGPEWYRLEVINSNGSSVPGRFAKPSQRSEDRACKENSVSDNQLRHGSFYSCSCLLKTQLIIFYTCEPLIMHDLPRTYVWRMQKDLGEICFR